MERKRVIEALKGLADHCNNVYDDIDDRNPADYFEDYTNVNQGKFKGSYTPEEVLEILDEIEEKTKILTRELALDTDEDLLMMA